MTPWTFQQHSKRRLRVDEETLWGDSKTTRRPGRENRHWASMLSSTGA